MGMVVGEQSEMEKSVIVRNDELAWGENENEKRKWGEAISAWNAHFWRAGEQAGGPRAYMRSAAR